jgi:hypothetical protein
MKITKIYDFGVPTPTGDASVAASVASIQEIAQNQRRRSQRWRERLGRPVPPSDDEDTSPGYDPESPGLYSFFLDHTPNDLMALRAQEGEIRIRHAEDVLVAETRCQECYARQREVEDAIITMEAKLAQLEFELLQITVDGTARSESLDHEMALHVNALLQVKLSIKWRNGDLSNFQVSSSSRVAVVLELCSRPPISLALLSLLRNGGPLTCYRGSKPIPSFWRLTFRFYTRSVLLPS